jgi:hypothetical protein
MRTHKDAKAMAKSLRDSLAARSVSLSHSECLEIVAKQSGFADWNTLSAKLDAESGQSSRLEHRSDLQPATLGGDCQEPRNAGPEQVSCSFCGKSKVRSLIEGGCSRDNRTGAHRGCLFICDECVALCAQVNADIIGGATSPENLSASALPE